MNWLKKILCLFTKGLYYINGPDILPPPLTGEEEQRVFRLLEQKDEWAKQQLITHNLRLVVYIAKKFDSTGINVEDLISIGTIGLIKAVNTFVPSKGIKLATYASRCIENEILMFLRKNQNRRTSCLSTNPSTVTATAMNCCSPTCWARSRTPSAATWKATPSAAWCSGRSAICRSGSGLLWNCVTASAEKRSTLKRKWRTSSASASPTSPVWKSVFSRVCAVNWT